METGWSPPKSPLRVPETVSTPFAKRRSTSSGKFGARYPTLGLNDAATLDEGTMWPTVDAITELTDHDATLVEDLVRHAVG